MTFFQWILQPEQKDLKVLCENDDSEAYYKLFERVFRAAHTLGWEAGENHVRENRRLLDESRNNRI